MRHRTPLLLLVMALAACTPESRPGPASSSQSAPTSVDPIEWKQLATPQALASRQVYQPQVFTHVGKTLVVWREKAPTGGSNLFAAHLLADGAMSDPVRVNDHPDTVMSWDHDENRPSVALGPEGRLAVAWTTEDSSVRAATSLDDGATFAPSVRLHQDEKPAYHAFPAVAFDSAGALHAAWIDARDAGHPRAEEPADLYYTRLDDGVALVEGAPEHNLTADLEGSVCGCCRLGMEVDDGRVTIAFRFASSDGFRDVFRVEGTTEGSFTGAERLGPPTWELSGCPSAGPATAAGTTLWNEASAKKWRTHALADGGGTPTMVLESTEEWAVTRPPRRVSGQPGAETLWLVPGRPTSKVLKGLDTVVDDVPEWVKSAAWRDGEIVVLGSVDGAAKLASRPLES